MRTCVTCMHFRDDDGAKCAHPNVTVDYVSGGTPHLRSAIRMREHDGPCGPEGQLWHQRPLDVPEPPQPASEAWEPPGRGWSADA